MTRNVNLAFCWELSQARTSGIYCSAWARYAVGKSLKLLSLLPTQCQTKELFIFLERICYETSIGCMRSVRMYCRL